MKFSNFWRTLFVSMMAVSAFVACSDDDDEGYAGIPEVTVNGASEVTLYRDLTEGATEAVSIVSNAAWTLAFEAESASTWCTPSAWQGGAGTTALSFTCSALESGEREAVAVVTAKGQMMGYPVTSVAKIKIHQTGAGETVVIYNTTVGNGDASSNPFADTYTDWNATGTGAAGVTYAIDGKVSVRSSGLSSAGAYEGASGPNVVFFGTAPTAFTIQKIALTPEQTNLKLTFGASSSVRDDAGNYDNSFDTSKFIVALSADGATWTNIEYTTNGGDQASPYWIFATSNFTLKEAVSDLYIRFSTTVSSAIRLDDITLTTGVGGTIVDLGEGGGVTPTPGEAIQTTIAELVAKIEPATSATVLDATNDYVFEGVVMNNYEVKNYAMNNLYLAAEGATAAKNGLVLYGSQVDATTLALPQGTRVKVTLKAGLASIQNRYGVFQITGAASATWCSIESLGSTAAISPITITADKIADYQGMYVQVEGTTTGTGLWCNDAKATTTTLTTANGNLLVYVNTVANETFTLPYAATTGYVKGIAMVYGNASSQTPELLPQSAADVAAFTPSTSEPTITGVNPTSLSWGADETGMKEVAVTGVDLAGNLTATVDNASFKAVVNGTTVEVTPAGANTTEADITATLTLTAGSSTKTVALKQSKPASQGGGTEVITVDFASITMPSDFPTSSYEKTEKTFNLAGYDFTFSAMDNGYKYDSTNKYIIFGKQNASIQFPTIAGKKLVKVVCVSRKGASGNVQCAITDASGTAIAGGEAIQWAQTEPYTYTYNLTGSEVGVAYRLQITTKYNAQLTSLELTFE